MKENEPAGKLDALKLAYKTLEEMQRKLNAYERKAHEPIAVVGMGCRFPGSSNTPARLWKLLEDGRDGITEIPPDRFDVESLNRKDGEQGPADLRYGGFVDQVAGFDAEFFNLSGDEATRMDPQQRLLLEVAYEAFEDAGATREALAGTRTGVYVGFMDIDYSHLTYPHANWINEHTLTGTITALLANRISYIFDLKGPSVSLDAACPSGLVATDTACRALRSGDISQAVVGAVTLNLSTNIIAGLSSYVWLAPDGRHKSYDAKADGIVVGEGCGVMVLKRLSDALRDGDRIHALIRSGSVASHGRTNGLNSPSPISTANVMSQAIEQAGLEPKAISLIEGHGAALDITDLAEIEALQRFYRDTPPDAKAYLGSVKSNLGHTKGACSMAAIFKVILCLQHKRIPACLHFEALPQGVTLPANVSIPKAMVDWDRPDGERYGMVEIFGAGGTVVAIVLGEAPPAKPPERLPAPAWGNRNLYVLPLSAHNNAALDARIESAGQYLSEAAARNEDVFDVCFTASVRRTHHSHRVAVVGRTPAELASALLALKAGDLPHRGARPSGQKRRTLFVLPDADAWRGVPFRGLAEHPVFAAALKECLAAVESDGERSLLTDALGSGDTSRSAVGVFAVELALARVWMSLGVDPHAVVGVGVGGVTAGCLSGALNVKDAVAILLGAGGEISIGPQRFTVLAPTGEELHSGSMTANYWRRCVADKPSVDAVSEALATSGYDLLLELGPASGLLKGAAAKRELVTAHSLAQEVDPWSAILGSLASLYSAGLNVDWKRAYPEGGNVVTLPTYPWQRKRYWIEDLGETVPDRKVTKRTE